MTSLAVAVEAALGLPPARILPLGGGCIAEVARVDLSDGRRLVAKRGAGLELEAWMLGYIAAYGGLPVPEVVHADSRLLLMTHVETAGGMTVAAETHAAELLAHLHGVAAPRFGLERDTVIAALPQPNPWTESWCDFFAEHRLLHMAGLAAARGRIDAALHRRIERLSGRLDRYLEPPIAPALLHGDVWGGNLLLRDGQVAAVIDPAIYYGDPEVELAFGTLFGTFGDAFFRRYGELRPLRPGFFELRRDLYNLYPLLVHAALFGGAYPEAVARNLSRVGE